MILYYLAIFFAVLGAMMFTDALACQISGEHSIKLNLGVGGGGLALLGCAFLSLMEAL